MQETIKLELDPDNIHNLDQYAQLLHKDMNTMINEALKAYFKNAEEKLRLESDYANTHFDFDEFWDGVEL